MQHRTSRRDSDRSNPFRTERRERSDRYVHDENPRRDFARDEEEHVGYPMRGTERRDWDTRYVHGYNDYDSLREGSNRSAYDEERGNWNSERRNDYENRNRYVGGKNSMNRPYDGSRVGDAERSSSNFDRHATYGADYSSDAARAGSFGNERSDTDIHYGSDRYSSFEGRDSSPRSFAGRGPKGFVRSDERIREEICEMLTHDPSIDGEDIEVEVKNGEVTLSGTVPERQMKYLAEDLAEHSFSVKDVVNNIRVKKTISSENRKFATESDLKKSESH